jgi:hypothetical protein
MLFDRPPSELPTATLRRSVHVRRGAPVLGLERGLSKLGAWLRPRRIPLLVAFASLFAMLGALETITSPGQRVRVVASGPLTRGPGPGAHASAAGGELRPCGEATRPPVRFVLRPLAPGGHTTVLTLVTLDPP